MKTNHPHIFLTTEIARVSLLVLLFFTFSCEENDSNSLTDSLVVQHNEQYTEPETTMYSEGFFLLNEGTFGFGNASLNFYNPTQNIVRENIFEQTNQYQIGDVLQSATLNNHELSLVVNNSQKIECIDVRNGMRIKTIYGLESPRYIEWINSEDIVVSDLYSKKLIRLNTNDGSVEAVLEVEGITEEIVRVGSELFVVHYTSIGDQEDFAEIIVVDDALTSVLNRINIPLEPREMVLDHQQNIWVLCVGKESKNVFPTILKMNPSTKEIIQTYPFPDYTLFPTSIAISGQSLLYNMGADIFEMNVHDTELPDQPLFSTQANIIYNITSDPVSGDLYISDAVDYVSDGTLYQYSNSGTLLNEWTTGVIPSEVVFVY